MNHGNENNRFILFFMMENGHSILNNVIKTGPKYWSTKEYITYSNFEKNI